MSLDKEYEANVIGIANQLEAEINHIKNDAQLIKKEIEERLDMANEKVKEQYGIVVQIIEITLQPAQDVNFSQLYDLYNKIDLPQEIYKGLTGFHQYQDTNSKSVALLKKEGLNYNEDEVNNDPSIAIKKYAEILGNDNSEAAHMLSEEKHNTEELITTLQTVLSSIADNECYKQQEKQIKDILELNKSGQLPYKDLVLRAISLIN